MELYKNYLMAWNRALVKRFEQNPETVIMAIYQFHRPIELDIKRLFDLSLSIGNLVAGLQLAVSCIHIDSQRLLLNLGKSKAG